MAELPAEIDTSRAHPARMYDYFLGGKNHFEADRQTAEAVLASAPSTRTTARENRGFLGRAVRFLAADAGIRQFLDIGTGLPTSDAVHEVAQSVLPAARVVYVDNDPLVLAHSRALLTSSREGRTAYIQADLREPSAILRDPAVADVLDLGQPVALILAMVLHFLTDDVKPAAALSALLDALPSGSYLVASHIVNDHLPRSTSTEAADRYRASGVPLQVRASDEFAELAFSGLSLVPPGVVLVSEWRPDGDRPRPSPSEVNCYGGVARKPLFTVEGSRRMDTRSGMAESPAEIDTPARTQPDLRLRPGRKNHFAVAAKAWLSMPSARIPGRENRAFLGRVVRYLTEEEGIRGFLDIGTGLPATGNVCRLGRLLGGPGLCRPSRRPSRWGCPPGRGSWTRAGTRGAGVK